MSQVAHSQVASAPQTLGDQLRAHRRIAIAALLALLATAAVVLTLVIGGDSSESVVSSPAPAQVSGPDESRVAEAVGTQSPSRYGGPDESRTATSISGPRP